MGFTKLIESGLHQLIGNNNVFKFDYCDKTSCYNGVYLSRRYCTIFEKSGLENDNKWEVELSLPLIDSCWSENKIDFNIFLKNFTVALLEKFGIKNQGAVTLYENPDNTQLIPKEFVTIYDDCFNEIDTFIENIIFIRDKSKIGKSLFMKFCCEKFKQKNNTDNIWWLDFNRGLTDMSDFISSLYKYKFDKLNYIIIDNIECCGIYYSQKILNFLIDFVEKINAHKTYIKLFIVLDSKQEIVINKSSNIRICKNILSDNFSENENQLLSTVEEILYTNIRTSINAFLTKNIYDDIKDDIRIKTLLLNIIYFSKSEIRLKINLTEKFSPDKRDVLKIMECVSGIKLTKSGEIICYSPQICERLLTDFKKEFFEVVGSFRGSGSILLDKQNDCFNDNVLSCYYIYLKENEIPISIADIQSILKNLDKKNTYVQDLNFILEKAKKANEFIIESVKKVNNDEYFNNHLGATLFALESLAVYAEKDYDSLNAWIELRNNIRKIFYVSNTEPILPSIRFGKVGIDKTINDFRVTNRSTCNQNSIESQIQLHNEVIKLTTFDELSNFERISDEDIEILMNSEVPNDTIFNFYISSVQKESDDKIDIDRFYRTYILALLFEAEVTAPEELIDELRIQQLWLIIRNNVIKNDDYFCYYPARVPWVTARMVLAMTIYLNRFPTSEISNEIKSLTEGFAKYFLKTSIAFTYKDKNYSFWSAGTGLWNSTLETTIMCALTLKGLLYYGDFKKVANQGVNFINLFKNEWFNENMLADGIWAYQATFDKRDVCNHITYFKQLISNIKFFNLGNVAKNDKSLGFSHIAKTLIDIAKEFVESKPELYDLQNDEPLNDALILSSQTIHFTESSSPEDTTINKEIKEVINWIKNNNTGSLIKISTLKTDVESRIKQKILSAAQETNKQKYVTPFILRLFDSKENASLEIDDRKTADFTTFVMKIVGNLLNFRGSN